MGNVTSNIGIYIPTAGETGYDASFAAGMTNIDQHDHSGGPNKGLPISTAAIKCGSLTASANIQGAGFTIDGTNVINAYYRGYTTATPPVGAVAFTPVLAFSGGVG